MKSAETLEADKVAINWAKLTDRLYQVPVDSHNYLSVQLNEEQLYLLTRLEDPQKQPQLQTTKIGPTPKLTTFVDDISGFTLSNDGEKLLVYKVDTKGDKHQIRIVPAKDKMPKDLTDTVVKTKDWQFNISPKDEWQQIFHDAWFMHRELFFDPQMRGVDWAAIKRKYQPLVDRTTARDELNDVFKQMMAELNALHSQVRGGDSPIDQNATQPGMLGAVLNNKKVRGKATGVEIVHIYNYDQELPSTAPPLAKSGVDAKHGDVITAINGTQISDLANLYMALQNQVGKQVLLQLQRGKNVVETVVVPGTTSSERQSRYFDWVSNNRTKVEQTDSNIGYLHLQSMSGRDVGSFATEFHADKNKSAIIIDVRRNNGGNVDSWIINHLMRQAWAFWAPRNAQPYVNMQRSFRGHLVVLADERTYSDGETFTAAIKHFGIADVIGRQTAGAGVWLNSSNRQSDGGLARVAQFPVFDLEGRWLVEGNGVAPTIEVINYPHATYNGQDTQLDAAIEYLQEKIEQAPVPPLSPLPFPAEQRPGIDID